MNKALSIPMFEEILRLVFEVVGSSQEQIEKDVIIAKEFVLKRSLDKLIVSLSVDEREKLKMQIENTNSNSDVFHLFGSFFPKQVVEEMIRVTCFEFAQTYFSDLSKEVTKEQKRLILAKIQTS